MSFNKDPFVEVAEDVALAAFIVVGHGVLVAVIIGVIAATSWLLGLAAHGDHEPHVAGLSARFIIEGGEIILIGVVLSLGIMSAFATLAIGFVRRLRRSS